MYRIPPEMLPQIITGVFVAICALMVTAIINRTAKKFVNIATKDYVRQELLEQSEQLGKIFVEANTQAQANAIFDQRMKYLEDQIWARFEKMLEMVLTKSAQFQRLPGS